MVCCHPYTYFNCGVSFAYFALLEETFSFVLHSDSLWHLLHTREGDEISMFLVPCLQSSSSTLSFRFFALFFCDAVSSCVYDHNHPCLVSERLFLAENKAFPCLRRALAHPRRALPNFEMQRRLDLWSFSWSSRRSREAQKSA